jgi:hypothetical protein
MTYILLLEGKSASIATIQAPRKHVKPLAAEENRKGLENEEG